ncbi:MAG: zinc-dependent alcohol dehydrogenase family protein [Myxococcales bacterium]
MRAFVVEQPGPLRSHPLVAREWPLPEPGTGQLRVRVHVCAVCRTDLHVAEGELPARVPGGIAPGHQAVGVVEAVGPEVDATWIGRRVGVAWLHGTCGRCHQCQRGRENLCELATFTGYTVQGGFAECLLARADFVYPLPSELSDRDAAPLLCAGIIGHRALSHAGLSDFRGARLGIYGFGAAGHIALQIARHRGAELFVATREPSHREFARQLGAVWAGPVGEAPPVPLDAALMFAPAGELVPLALSHLDRGARLVLGGIHMSDLPTMPYSLLYGERCVLTVANNTRADGHAFLAEAAQAKVRVHSELFPLSAVNEALQAVKESRVNGAAVLDNT